MELNDFLGDGQAHASAGVASGSMKPLENDKNTLFELVGETNALRKDYDFHQEVNRGIR